MDFFINLRQDESDRDSDSVDVVDENPESQIDPYWFQITDSDEDEEEHRVFGKEKIDREIQAAIDTYDYSISSKSWTDAKEQLEDLLDRAEKYKLKYRESSQAVIEYIRDHADLAEELEGKSKRDFGNPRDFNSLKQLQELIKEVKAKHEVEMEEERRQQDAADNDDEDADESESAFAKRIIDVVQDKRNVADRLYRLANKCGKHGYTSLRISALGHFAIAVFKKQHTFLVERSKWEEACRAAEECLSLLKGNPNITLSEDIRQLETGSNRVTAIMGGLTEVLSSLQTRLLHVSQAIKCSELEYLWVPVAENRLARLADGVLAYYRTKERANRRRVVECCQVLLSLIGFRTQKAHDILYGTDNSSPIISASMLDTVKEIYRVIAASATQSEEAIKMAAVCYIGYQYGLAGQFRQGRDVLLRAGVPSFIAEKKDCSVQLYILYNRVIAQLGLAAFVGNQIDESYALLGTLWEKYNPAVLIGQAIPQSKDVEEEIKNRDQTIQHHYEIPHQHLELAAMLSALVVDTVNEAKKPYERSRVQKFFYRAISHPPQLLCASSSSVKDQVFAAHKALKAGDYFGAKRVVESMKAWRTLENGDEVLANYLQRLKEAALRVFCFSNRTNFTTFSVEQLADKYDMEPQEVRDIVNDMIWDSDSLVAYWDRDDTFLYVDRSNPTRLQHIVMGAADSVVELAPFKDPRARVNDSRGRGGGGGRGGRGAGGRGRGRGRGN